MDVRAKVAAPGVGPDDFVKDRPFTPRTADADGGPMPTIDGVTLEPLCFNGDSRGLLVELLTQRDREHAPIVHVYQVHCEPGSIRGWVYHDRQSDRLCFTAGTLRIALYDLREDSPTAGALNVFDLGAARPCRLTIPPFVAHALHNPGAAASFVNLPTRVYEPGDPDKWRLPYPDRRIPFRFED